MPDHYYRLRGEIWNNPDPYTVFYSMYYHAHSCGMSSPAAFIGQWLGYKAVIFPQLHMEENFPIRRGWIGYYSYPHHYPAQFPYDSTLRLPALIGSYPDDVVVLDQQNQWWCGKFSELQPADNASEDTHELLSNCALAQWLEAIPPRTLPHAIPLEWYPPDANHHAEMIAACHAAIKRGDVYQVNICSAYHSYNPYDPIDLFCGIGSHIHAIKSVFFSGTWGAVVSFSPESFLTTRGQTISMSPIKGTLPITDDPAILAHSPKDRAENIMIVDVVRNDLCKIIEYHSLIVSRVCEIISAPGVWHLQSHIEGTLRPNITPHQILEATYPIPSITGAPKIRACELINQWEQSPRGVYCGCAGIVTLQGDMDLSVLIRTLEITATNQIRLGVGGGITIDSHAEREYAELTHKAQSIITHTR